MSENATHDSTNPKSDLRGLLRFQPELAEEIYAFQRAAYPHRDDALVEPRWNWMFLEPARRLGIDPYVWIYRRKGEIVAHQGAIGVQFKLGNTTHTTGWFVETMALESVRGKSIGPMVIQKALEDLPFNLSLGQTETMRSLQFALGWEQVAPLQTYALMLKPSAVLRHKINNPLARLAAGWAIQGRRQLSNMQARPTARGETTVRQIERYDERHDVLWREVADEFPCTVIRDAAFLNWKFVDQPGQEFVRLEVASDGKPVGLAVLTVREPDEAYRYRRALLLDVVVSPSDPNAVWRLLEVVEQTSRQLQAEMLFFDLLNRPLEKQLLRYGFLAREQARVLLLSTKTLSAADQQTVMNPDHWLITRADSDIDRPW